MQITLLGVIWLACLTLSYISKRNRIILYFTSIGMLMQCSNVFVINGIGVGVQPVTACATWLYLLFFGKRRPIKTRIRYGAVYLNYIEIFALAILLVTFVNLLINGGVQGKEISLYIILAYVFLLCSMAHGRLLVSRSEIEDVLDTVFATVFIIGVLQMLAKSGVVFLKEPLKTLIYNDVGNSDVIFNYKDTNAFYSMLMEPSYCGAFLVGVFTSLLMRSDITRKTVILSVLCFLSILLTRSTTAYAGLCIAICLLLFCKAKKKLFKYWIPFFILGAIILFLFFGGVLDEVIFKKSTTASYRVRNRWNVAALENFRQHPLTGVGYKNSRASSLLLSLLAEFGIVGCIPYFGCVLFLLRNAVAKNSKRERDICVLVIGVVICQFIACPGPQFFPILACVDVCGNI